MSKLSLFQGKHWSSGYLWLKPEVWRYVSNTFMSYCLPRTQWVHQLWMRAGVWVLLGRYSCWGPLCWIEVGPGGVPHTDSETSRADSKLNGLSSSTPPWTAWTAALPAASGWAGTCFVVWRAGRRAGRLERVGILPVSCWINGMQSTQWWRRTSWKAQYRVRRVVFHGASSPPPWVLRIFLAFPIRSCTYRSSNLILA